MANWQELPQDLINLMAKRVKVMEDFIAFGGVCTSWRTAAAKENYDDALLPRVPLLMLAERDDENREFYSLSKGKVSRILHLPEARGRQCFPSQGWLFTMSFTGEFNLLHPFSRTQIELPHEKNIWALHGYDQKPKGDTWHFIEHAVLSANPSLTSDYVLVISYWTDTNYLAFWRPGDLNWTHFEMDRLAGFACMAYYKGEFYCVTYIAELCVFSIAGPSNRQPIVEKPIVETRIVYLDYDPKKKLFNQRSTLYYLVEVNGALLYIARSFRRKSDGTISGNPYETYKFSVHEIDVIKGGLKEINTLENSTIFLGRNGASSIDSSPFAEVKPNHIYFSDAWYEEYNKLEEGGGRDMGAYNLEDGKIEYFYTGLSLSRTCPPTWVTPSL